MPIQETITANVGGTLQALDQVRGKMDALTRSTDRANRAAKEQQKALRDRLGNASKLGAGAGGSFGGNVGRFSQVGAMGGGFGALGVGVVALGVGFRALGQIIQSRIEDEKKAIQIGQQIRKINDDAARKEGASGLRGVGDSKAILSLIARGGSEAEAGKLAQGLGIPLREAIDGLAELQLLPAYAREAVKATAIAGQRSGLVSFGQVIGEARSDPLARRDAMSGNGLGTDLQVARVASRILGSDISSNDVGRAIGSQRSDPLTGQIAEINRFQNRSSAEDIQRTSDGTAAGAAQQAMIENLVPAAFALSELNRQAEQTVQGLRQLESSTSGLAKLFMVLTGQETPTTQLLRFQRVQGQAIANADNNAPRGGR